MRNLQELIIQTNISLYGAVFTEGKSVTLAYIWQIPRLLVQTVVFTICRVECSALVN